MDIGSTTQLITPMRQRKDINTEVGMKMDSIYSKTMKEPAMAQPIIMFPSSGKQ